MADAEDQIVFGERFIEKGAECGGVGGQADAKIDMGSDDAGESSTVGYRRNFTAEGKGVLEEEESLAGVRWIARGVMLSG
jgi:hypothetical protein